MMTYAKFKKNKKNADFGFSRVVLKDPEGKYKQLSVKSNGEMNVEDLIINWKGGIKIQ